MLIVIVWIVAVSELALVPRVAVLALVAVVILAAGRAAVWVVVVPVARPQVVLGAPWVVQHNVTVTLELNSDLLVDKLEEAVLVHLVVEIVRLIGTFFEPGPRHL